MRITSGQALDQTGAALLVTVAKIYREDAAPELSKGCNQLNGDGIYNLYPPFEQTDGIVEIAGPARCEAVKGFLSQLLKEGLAELVPDPTDAQGGQRLVTHHPFA